MSVKATLAGVPLTAVQRYSWAFTSGTRPHQRVFETSRDTADAILKERGQPVTLEIEAPGRPKLIIANIHILQELPGSMPHTKSVLVSDRRWLWPQRLITRDYNLRRRTGEYQLVGDDLRIEKRPLKADVTYAPWSLRNGKTPWLPEQVLYDVLQALVGGEFTIPQGLKRKIEVEDLSLDHSGDLALWLVLSYLGGYDVALDYQGRVYVFDTRDRSEVNAITSAGPPLISTGWRGDVDRSYSRPQLVQVFFDRECELRFDFLEGATLSRDKNRPDRALENVLPAPLKTMTVAGRKVAEATWIGMDEYLDALPATPIGGKLTQARIRRIWTGLWNFSRHTFCIAANGEYDPLLTRKYNAVGKNWRQTFRVTPPWMDKLRSIRAYRVAVIDQETGTRAPSEAYMQYLVIPTVRGLGKTLSERNEAAAQVEGYAALLKDAKASPAEVMIIDGEAGIIRISFRPDPFFEAERYVHGVVKDAIPRNDPSFRHASAGRNDILALWQDVELKDSWKCAVVLTGIQASPNNLGRYHREDVTPQQASAVLGEPIGESKGAPACQVIVSGNIATARFAWDDNRANDIEKAFFDGDDYPIDLLSNRKEVRALAEAEAARIYGSMLDRIEGAFRVALNPDIRLAGSLQRVEHTIDVDGTATTALLLSPEIEPLNPMALVPQGIQRAVRRLVEP